MIDLKDIVSWKRRAEIAEADAKALREAAIRYLNIMRMHGRYDDQDLSSMAEEEVEAEAALRAAIVKAEEKTP